MWFFFSTPTLVRKWPNLHKAWRWSYDNFPQSSCRVFQEKKNRRGFSRRETGKPDQPNHPGISWTSQMDDNRPAGDGAAIFLLQQALQQQPSACTGTCRHGNLRFLWQQCVCWGGLWELYQKKSAMTESLPVSSDPSSFELADIFSTASADWAAGTQTRPRLLHHSLLVPFYIRLVLNTWNINLSSNSTFQDICWTATLTSQREMWENIQETKKKLGMISGWIWVKYTAKTKSYQLFSNFSANILSKIQKLVLGQ